MARIRTLKPEFFRSRALQRVSLHARVTFQGLWCEADDDGNGIADARLLKGALWALDDEVSWQHVDGWLGELEANGQITLYKIGGERYYAVKNWAEHQVINRKSKPRVPSPPSVDTEGSVSDTSADTEQAVQELGTGSEERGGEGARADNAFALTDELREWATVHRFTVTQVDDETERFVAWNAARAKDYADWGAAWRTWMLRVEPAGCAPPRPPCEFCDDNGWVLPDGSETSVRCACNPKLEAVSA